MPWSARAGLGTRAAPRWTRPRGGPRCGDASRQAGGLDDVAAISVGGQQHGMVCLDEHGEVVRPALLWNDTRSAQAAVDLIDELGGAQAWVDAVGLVPVASFTVTKLRWLAEHEPEHADRTAAVALPHDWLTWRLSGARQLDTLCTDRGDASGTGYWSPTAGTYRRDLVGMALGTRRPAADGARPARPRRRDGGRRVARAGHRRQHGRRARTRRRAGHGGGLDRYVRRRICGHGDAGRRPRGSRGRLRGRDRAVPPAGGDVERRAGARRLPGCSASTTPSCPGSRCRHRLARTGSCSCRTSRASARRTGRTPPARCTACDWQHDASAPRPGRRRGPAVRAARRGRRARAGRRHRGPRDDHRRRLAARGGAADRPDDLRLPRAGPAGRRVRRERRGPPGRVGAHPASGPPSWTLGATAAYVGDHLPWVLDRYQEAQSLVLDRLR